MQAIGLFGAHLPVHQLGKDLLIGAELLFRPRSQQCLASVASQQRAALQYLL